MTVDKIKYINTLKGLGIIAVVLGHCGAPFTPVIYSYHMALFFFITGYLYKDSYEKNFFTFILKKLKSLYIPFLGFEICFVLLRNIFININIYNSSQIAPINSLTDWVNVFKQIITFNYTGDNLLSAIWFLKTLFFVNILFITFNIISKKIFNNNEYIKFICIIILTYIFFYALRYGYNPVTYFNPNNKKVLSVLLSIFDCRNFFLLSIYYFGSLYKKLERKIQLNIYISVFFTLFLIIVSKWRTIDVANYNFTSPHFFIICGLCGIYTNLYLAKKILLLKYNFLESLGKASLYIMLLHFLAFKLVNLIFVIIYKLPLENISAYPVLPINEYSWIIYTLFGVIIPLLLHKIFITLKNTNVIKINFGINLT